MTDTYDCTPHPKPEGIVHHTARVITNLFHPHHKHAYFAPMALVCKVPEMETVTVTASQDAPPSLHLPPDALGGFPGGAYSGYGYDGCMAACTVQSAPNKPVGVPEPGAWALMVPALFAVLLAYRKVRS